MFVVGIGDLKLSRRTRNACRLNLLACSFPFCSRWAVRNTYSSSIVRRKKNLDMIQAKSLYRKERGKWFIQQVVFSYSLLYIHTCNEERVRKNGLLFSPVRSPCAYTAVVVRSYSRQEKVRVHVTFIDRRSWHDEYLRYAIRSTVVHVRMIRIC